MASPHTKNTWLIAGMILLAGVLLMIPRKWKLPAGGQQYGPYFSDAESRYGLPPDLLARVADQESSFRPDVIDGTISSPAGAVGLMQIMPRWHPNVNALDPIASIYYAAGYLARLHAQFGTWELALAAYNWGPGNLAERGMDAAPRETQNYVREISRDVELA